MSQTEIPVDVDVLRAEIVKAYMLHGAKAVPNDLFSRAIALLVDGIAARAEAAGLPVGGIGV